MNYANKDQILRDFEKMVVYYNLKSVIQYGNFFDDMDGLLTLFLLELIQKGKCVSKRYVAVAIRNEYIRISKKFLALYRKEKEFVKFCIDNDFAIPLEDKIVVKDVLKRLTEKQQEVIKLRYIGGFSCDEIAHKNGVSRQAISRIENRALDKLKAML